MNIEILDHLILADTRCCSFKGDGTPVSGIARRSDRLPR